VGEVLDAAVRLYRARFGALMTVSIAVLIPVSILSMFVLLSALPDESATVTVNATNSPVFGSGDNAAQLGALFVSSILSALATTFVTAATTRIVRCLHAGRQVDAEARSGTPAARWRSRPPHARRHRRHVDRLPARFARRLAPLVGGWRFRCSSSRAGVFNTRRSLRDQVRFWLAFGVVWLSQLP
jgi:hypothetical protein